MYFLIDILAKEFGQEDNNGQDSMTWHNREKDWYNAERRFIFATKTTKRRDKWIEEGVKERVKTGLKQGMMAVI